MLRKGSLDLKPFLTSLNLRPKKPSFGNGPHPSIPQPPYAGAVAEARNSSIGE
jgi:hypothetical protein